MLGIYASPASPSNNRTHDRTPRRQQIPPTHADSLGRTLVIGSVRGRRISKPHGGAQFSRISGRRGSPPAAAESRPPVAISSRQDLENVDGAPEPRTARSGVAAM